jgi:hypothetical protein
MPCLASVECAGDPQGWPDTLDLFVLRNEYPATVHFAQEHYPSVLHGYWTLSAADPRDRAAIRDATSAREAVQSREGQSREGQSVDRIVVFLLRLSVLRSQTRAVRSSLTVMAREPVSRTFRAAAVMFSTCPRKGRPICWRVAKSHSRTSDTPLVRATGWSWRRPIATETTRFP